MGEWICRKRFTIRPIKIRMSVCIGICISRVDATVTLAMDIQEWGNSEAPVGPPNRLICPFLEIECSDSNTAAAREGVEHGLLLGYAKEGNEKVGPAFGTKPSLKLSLNHFGESLILVI
jgi:hypothetical protein